jgi:beta-1,2-mannosidase
MTARGIPTWGLGPFVREDSANPILSPRGESRFACPMRGAEVAWEANHVFNPAAIVRNGRVHLLYRAEDSFGEGIGGHTSRIGLAESADGVHFTRHAGPVLAPGDDAQRRWEWPGGCEDPRVVEAEDGRYVLTYTQWDRQCARLAVATSPDLVSWTKHGPAFGEAHGGAFLDAWSKSGAIVTRREGNRMVAARSGGRYWMFWGERFIYLATSTDLICWTPLLDSAGDLAYAFGTRDGFSDSLLVEPGPPAVLTPEGIVFLYNSKNCPRSGDSTYPADVYTAYQALLDPEDPGRLLARTEVPFFLPERDYERTGQYTAGTTFLEGLAPLGERWLLYYGTADSHVAVAASDSRRA